MTKKEIESVLKEVSSDKVDKINTTVKFIIPTYMEEVIEMFTTNPQLVIDLAQGYYDGTVKFIQQEESEKLNG